MLTLTTELHWLPICTLIKRQGLHFRLKTLGSLAP